MIPAKKKREAKVMSVLNVVSEGPNIVAEISGKIDAINSQEIQDEAIALLGDEVESFTFNMRGVTYVSSAGLRMFSAVARACKGSGIEYMLDELRPDFVKMFKLTGYASSFKMRELQEV